MRTINAVFGQNVGPGTHTWNASRNQRSMRKTSTTRNRLSGTPGTPTSTMKRWHYKADCLPLRTCWEIEGTLPNTF